MLRLDLVRLERDGRLQIEADIPADDQLWDGTGFSFSQPVQVRLVASLAGTGELVVRGRVVCGRVEKCRRCRTEVPGTVEKEVTLVYAPGDGTESPTREGDVRPLELTATQVELGEDVREELVLSFERYVVCEPSCRGLCHGCGVNLNLETCDCAKKESDPRWGALRSPSEHPSRD